MLHTLLFSIATLLATARPVPRVLPIVDIDSNVLASAVLLTPSMAITSAHATGEVNTMSFVKCGDEIMGAAVVKRGVTHDLALLVLSGRCLAVGQVELGDGDATDGMPIELLGYPNRTLTRSVGTAGGFQLLWRETTGVFWLGLVLSVTPQVNPGNSGGPVLDAKSGKLVGLVSAYLESKDGKQHVGIAIPVSSIRLFLNTPTN